MSDDNTRDWPTFTDILDELNALGPAPHQDPIIMRHLGPSRVGTSTAVEDAPETSSEPEASEAPEQDVVSPTPLDVPAAALVADVSLPEALAPVEIDTAALDEAFVPAPPNDLAIDTTALDPVDAVEVALASPDLDGDEPDSEAVDAELEVIATAADVEATDAEPTEPAAADTIAEFTPIDNPFQAVDAAEPAPALDPITGEIDWSTWDGAPAATTEAPVLGEFDFSATPADPMPPPPEQEALPATSEFSTWSPPTEAEEPPAAEEVDDQEAFDSVATADAIENDLQELFDLDKVSEENNVVPLHPSSDDHADAVVGLDAVFDQDSKDTEQLQEWVGIEPEELRPADPWAHMRPDEHEDVKAGFWKNRKKFFGGDERRTKRAEREGTESADEASSVPTGPPCPNCEAPGHIDLQDPVGGKVHLSCSACDQVWAVRYEDGDEQPKSA